MQGITFVLQGVQGFLPWKLLHLLSFCFPKVIKDFFITRDKYIFFQITSLLQVSFFFSVGTLFYAYRIYKYY